MCVATACILYCFSSLADISILRNKVMASNRSMIENDRCSVICHCFSNSAHRAFFLFFFSCCPNLYLYTRCVLCAVHAVQCFQSNRYLVVGTCLSIERWAYRNARHRRFVIRFWFENNYSAKLSYFPWYPSYKRTFDKYCRQFAIIHAMQQSSQPSLCQFVVFVFVLLLVMVMKNVSPTWNNNWNCKKREERKWW